MSNPSLPPAHRYPGLAAIFVIAMLGFASTSLADGESVLYSFTGGADGGTPFAGLVLGANGALFGTTTQGGSTACGTLGCGTAFELTPPTQPGGAWTETVLHDFTGGTDGFFPSGGLLQGANGVLYGTTEGDGVTNFGTVFELTPPATPGGAWTETVLYNFTGGTDQGSPKAGLIADSHGVLYGTTSGGNVGNGTAFSLTPPAVVGGKWIGALLLSFGGSFQAAEPDSTLVMDANGVLYGTSLQGGVDFAPAGTAFSLTPPGGGVITWTETVLASFSNLLRDGDLSTPIGGLLAGPSGTLYGTTAFGGGAFGAGGVFALTPPSTVGGPWNRTYPYIFMSSNPNNGENPYGGLVSDASGTLYGTTMLGGANVNNGLGDGVVYSLTPPNWTEAVLHAFTGNPDGGAPRSTLVMDSNGILYGTSTAGGAFNNGTVFSVNPTGSPTPTPTPTATPTPTPTPTPTSTPTATPTPTPSPTPTAVIGLKPTTLNLVPAGPTQTLKVAPKGTVALLGPIVVAINQSGSLFAIRVNKCTNVMILKPGQVCEAAFAASSRASGKSAVVTVGAANAANQTATLQATASP